VTTRRPLLGLLVAVAASVACDRPAPPRAALPDATGASTVIPAPVPTVASTTAAPAPTPVATTTAAVPVQAATAILRSAVAVEPGARLPLAPGTEVVVAPAATFEVEFAARAPDARLVLVDSREDLVPASATRELSSGTRLTLSPAEPLIPGSRYALRLDGASRRELHDEGGRAFSAVSLPLLAAGSPPPPEPKKPAKRRKHH
jgi:hypothetical protein